MKQSNKYIEDDKAKAEHLCCLFIPKVLTSRLPYVTCSSMKDTTTGNCEDNDNDNERHDNISTDKDAADGNINC